MQLFETLSSLAKNNSMHMLQQLRIWVMNYININASLLSDPWIWVQIWQLILVFFCCRIDENMEDTLANVEGAQGALLKYLNSISSNRWLMIKIFFVLIFFLMVFLFFVAWSLQRQNWKEQKCCVSLLVNSHLYSFHTHFALTKYLCRQR